MLIIYCSMCVPTMFPLVSSGGDEGVSSRLASLYTSESEARLKLPPPRFVLEGEMLTRIFGRVLGSSMALSALHNNALELLQERNPRARDNICFSSGRDRRTKTPEVSAHLLMPKPEGS